MAEVWGFDLAGSDGSHEPRKGARSLPDFCLLPWNWACLTTVGCEHASQPFFVMLIVSRGGI